MKRFSLRHAFGGEGNPSQEGIAVEGTGLDAVEVGVSGISLWHRDSALYPTPLATPEKTRGQANARSE